MAKKIYVLDTSVYLSDPNAIYMYGNNDIIVPFMVLEELDKQKQRQDVVGANARAIVRILDELRKKKSLTIGSRIARGKGLLFAKGHKTNVLPKDFNINVPDNKIIAVALTEKKENPTRKVIVVSRDINLRVKCDALGLLSEDYEVGQVVKDREMLYTGFTTYLVDDQIIDQFYAGEQIILEKEDIKLYPHQFVMLISNHNDKKTALARFIDYNKPLKRVEDYKNKIWGVKPRNKEQSFALNLLMDSDVPLVSIVGASGSGKSLLSIAAALELTLECKKYKRVIIIRPTQNVGGGPGIGFLPGSIDEKLRVWLKPIEDNLMNLMGNETNGYEILEDYKHRKIIEIECLSFIRGRSISDAFIIVDEAQNLTQHEMKTLVTRIGERSKLVFNGDLKQIDVSYLNEHTSGLSITIEKLKEESLTAHITLLKSERSRIASIGDKLL